MTPAFNLQRDPSLEMGNRALDKANVSQVVKSVVIASSNYPTTPGNIDIITLRTIMNSRICRQ